MNVLSSQPLLRTNVYSYFIIYLGGKSLVIFLQKIFALNNFLHALWWSKRIKKKTLCTFLIFENILWNFPLPFDYLLNCLLHVRFAFVCMWNSVSICSSVVLIQNILLIWLIDMCRDFTLVNSETKSCDCGAQITSCDTNLTWLYISSVA